MLEALLPHYNAYLADRRANPPSGLSMSGNPFLELFRAGQADGSIDAALPIDVTYLALVSSMTGTSQRLLIETKWTTGTDERARLVHETLIDVWRQALAPKDHS